MKVQCMPIALMEISDLLEELQRTLVDLRFATTMLGVLYAVNPGAHLIQL